MFSHVFLSGLIIITAVYIYRSTPAPDNKFLIRLFASAVTVRCFLTVFLMDMAYAHHNNGFISGDELLYSDTALLILEDVRNGTFVYKPLYFGMNIYTYMLAFFYGVFGFNPLTVAASKFINCYIGAVTPVVAYFITRRLADSRAARVAAALCAFYPSLIFWSAHNIKEPLIILSTCMGMHMLIRVFSRKITLNDIVFFILYAVFVFNLQLLYLYQVGVIAAAFALAYSSRPMKACLVFLLVASAAALFMNRGLLHRFFVFAGDHQWHMATTDLAGYYMYTRGFLADMAAGRIDLLTLFSIYFRGLLYFLFSPFFWRTGSLLQLLALPQVLAWYLLLGMSALGLWRSFNENRSFALAVFMTVAIGMSFWAFTEGNVGAAFRHRDHFSAVILVFAGIGIVRCERYVKGKIRWGDRKAG